jgi:hypothetical protein
MIFGTDYQLNTRGINGGSSVKSSEFTLRMRETKSKKYHIQHNKFLKRRAGGGIGDNEWERMGK